VRAQKLVLIGTSAGGVEALQEVSRGMPENFGAPILVVMHYPAHTPSRLAEILSRAGPLEAKMAEDGEAMKRSQIYIAPSDHHLLVESNRIRLTRGPKENRSRPAIDAMFRSAAHSVGPRAIGIVLTGMLDDGTAGLWAIKDQGGCALVQDPGEAQYDSMPRSAIRYVAVDQVLKLADIPAALARIVNEPPASRVGNSERMGIEAKIAAQGDALQRGVMQLGKVSGNSCPACHGVLTEIHDGPILRYRCHTGHAFSMKTLLADVDAEVDTTLYAAMRALEERAILLKQFAELARTENNGESVKIYERASKAMAARAQQVKGLVQDMSLKSIIQ
jgi:two-component system, chemotaxis family, protein-glutamate methylesterase/glutaminase